MKDTQIIMGMPITVEINEAAAAQDMKECFDYFREVDRRYSTYKPDSEVSLLNAGQPAETLSQELHWVLELCEATKADTKGYFDIKKADGSIDPSGLVKGWAIQNAANRLLLKGCENFYIEAGGDVQVHGLSSAGQPWELGIRNPFKTQEIVKVLRVSNCGIATSGNYIRGSHIYNPHEEYDAPQGIASITVVGPTVYDADRYATAAFAMGDAGIAFIQELAGFDGYMINDQGVATFTRGFEAYVA